jgi:hypothetical protein
VTQLVTQTEFAQIRGVTKAAVNHAMKRRIAGAIVIDGGRRLLDAQLAMRLWDKNTVPNNNAVITGRVRPQPGEAAKLTKPVRPREVDLARLVMQVPDDMIPDIGESEERRAHYNAELAKLKALREREELGSIAEMRNEAFSLAKATREAVLGVCPRISAELAATADAFAVEQLLERELIAALRSLAAVNG